MLLPTIIIVFGIVLGPLLANFWISFKPVQLGDLRAAKAIANEQIRPKITDATVAGEEVIVRYRIRNSSQKEPVQNVTMRDVIPQGLIIQSLDNQCQINDRDIFCNFGTIEAKGRFNLEIPVIVTAD